MLSGWNQNENKSRTALYAPCRNGEFLSILNRYSLRCFRVICRVSQSAAAAVSLLRCIISLFGAAGAPNKFVF